MPGAFAGAIRASAAADGHRALGTAGCCGATAGRSPTSGRSLPEIREEAHHQEAEASACAWIQGPGRTGTGISVRLAISPAAQVAELAEQLQNWAADQLHDAGLPPAWPACPEHPSQPHELAPEVRDGAAVWICGESGEVIWAIGALDVPGSGARRGGKRDRRKARQDRRPGSPGAANPYRG